MKRLNSVLIREILLILMCSLVILSFIFDIIKSSKYLILSKEDLLIENLSVQEVIVKSRSSEILFVENNNRYYIENKVGFDDELLASLESNDEVMVYIVESSYKEYDYEIIEMYYQDQAIVTIDNYYNQYKLSTIIYISIIAILSLLMVIYIFLSKRSSKVNIKPITVDLDNPDTKKRYDLLKNSFYIKNKKHTSDVLTYLDGEVDLLYVVVFDLLNNGELRLVNDECCEDDSMAFLLYKNHDKLLFEYISKNNNGLYELSLDYYSWTYPIYEELNDKEKDEYKRVSNQFVLLNSDYTQFSDNKKEDIV